MNPFRYELDDKFIENIGDCPGCNVDVANGGFWSNLNPRNWFNGIGSLSEGIAMVAEIIVYLIVLLLLIMVVRKIVWPLLKWSLQAPIAKSNNYKDLPTV